MVRGMIAIAVATLFALSGLRCHASQEAKVQSKMPSDAGTLVRTTGLVTSQYISAVLLAIQDEIYAGRCAPAFLDIGKSVGQGEKIHQINVYFAPYLKQGMASVIYKFWPFGEVNRMYWIDKSGLAHLAGHPAWDFPPTEPSYLTIYMGDRQLCRLKAEWKRVPLEIEISPSLSRVREAIARQKQRGGDLGFCTGRWRP